MRIRFHVPSVELDTAESILHISEAEFLPMEANWEFQRYLQLPKTKICDRGSNASNEASTVYTNFRKLKYVTEAPAPPINAGLKAGGSKRLD